MDNLRLILIVILALLGVQIYSAWQKDYHSVAAHETASSEQDVPTLNPQTATQKAMASDPDASQAVPENPPASAQNSTENSQNIQNIRIVTDVLDVTISTTGGSIVDSKLLKYPQELGSDLDVQMQSQAPNNYYVVQSGLIGSEKDSLPSHKQVFSAQQNHYELGDAQSLQVPLTWEQNGIKVTKVFTFSRDSYLIKQQTTVSNHRAAPLDVSEYRRILRVDSKDKQPFVYTYTGGVYYNQEDKYEKLPYDDMQQGLKDKIADHGWAAMIQHYFISAIVPNPDEKNEYFSTTFGSGDASRYVLGMTSLPQQVAAGQSHSLETQYYIGPKIIKRLKKVAEGLELAVDFGVLTIISKPMFIGLDFLHGFIGNWGFAIIILTMLLKLAFFPLANKSYKSMAKMKKIMPEIARLKERYGDDRQRIAKEQMALFKKHQVNPAAGCLPMLIQMPFFMGLYWALLESVELRQAPFILWIHDLSIADPWFVLPVIMGASMYLSQKMNPPPADPLQAKMMQFMPIAFSVIFFLLPAGLVLYSVTNSILSIVQQYVITQRINREN